MDDPIKQPADKLWSELPPEQVRHFYEKLKERADTLNARANETLAEFAKFLFAANTGSAAGLFLLLKSSPNKSFLAAFFLFCAGAFCVGVAHFITNKWYEELAEGFAADINSWGRNEMTIRTLDERHRKRLTTNKRKLAMFGHYSSLGFLISGGVLAAFTIWNAAKT